MKHLLALTFALGFVSIAPPFSPVHAQRTTSGAANAMSHRALRSALFISPGIVNVGGVVVVKVTAPFPSTVRITFRSAHHVWSSIAPWQRSLGAYVLYVRIIPRVHALEPARVVAQVTPHVMGAGGPYGLVGQFWIRGLSMGMGMGHM